MEKGIMKLLQTMEKLSEEYERDTSPVPTRGEQFKTGPKGQGRENRDLNENPAALSYEELTSKKTKDLMNMDRIEKTIRFLKLSDKLEFVEASVAKYKAGHYGCGKVGCPANLTVGTTGPKNGAKKQDWVYLINNEKSECGSSSCSASKVSDETGSSVEYERAVEQDWGSPINNEKPECGSSSSRSTKKVSDETDSSVEHENAVEQELVKPTKKKAQKQDGSASKTKAAKTRSSAKQEEPASQEWVPIGSGITLIPSAKYKKYKDMDSYTRATRILLMALFSRSVLATHTLTGKPSPAFPDKPSKRRLDKQKVSDLIAEVMAKFEVTKSSVRNAITIKCADESKMSRIRSKKSQLIHQVPT